MREIAVLKGYYRFEGLLTITYYSFDRLLQVCIIENDFLALKKIAIAEGENVEPSL